MIGVVLEVDVVEVAGVVDVELGERAEDLLVGNELGGHGQHGIVHKLLRGHSANLDMYVS